MTFEMLAAWEARLAAWIGSQEGRFDTAHDLAHVERVARTAKALAAAEGARLPIVIPAAWLHDCVSIPKSSTRRDQASRMAATEADGLLRSWGYPAELLPAIRHAIEAHSFTAGIEPETLEAEVVQDADRLDALGALGLARCLMVSGASGRPLYDRADPFVERRPPDDDRSAIDHFHAKLLNLAGTLRTRAARREGWERAAYLRAFLDRLRAELAEPLGPDALGS